MEQDYLKYLKTEREISEFKIESLKKMLQKGDASTRRLLAIEEEFMQIPFEKIAGSLSELLSAIKTFRDSRTNFHDIYTMDEKKKRSDQNLDLAINSIRKKILDIDFEIKNSRIKVARDRSRILIILLCIMLYIDESKRKISDLKLSISESDLLSEMGKKYEEDIFVFYNQVIDSIDDFDFISDSSKKIISEIKKLENISNIEDCDFFTIKQKLFRSKKIFGFFLPSKHSGRETLKPYYINLFDEDGLNVSKLFSSNPKAILLNDEYYKFISLLSPDKLKDNLVLLDKYEEFMKKIFHLKLSGKDNISIDVKSSTILVPCSRTEDEGIRAALESSSAIFSSIITTIL